METHIGCGERVINIIEWWEDWLVWVCMPVCLKCGGPLVENVDIEWRGL